MQIRYFTFYLLLLSLCLTPGVTLAEEITLQHRGLTLNADLALARGKTLADGVILVTHGALAHRDMETIVYLRKLLKERGYNTLAINLGLGVDNRHGMHDCMATQRHSNDAAVDDIGLWVNWLKTRGASRVILLGHSRGGAQTALYAAERHNELLKSVLLLAPATGDNTSPEAYRKRYGRALQPLLQKARALVEEGKGDALLEHVGLMTCADTTVTAGTFMSYYEQDPRLDTPYLLTRIQAPTLVLVAGDDQVVVDLDKKLTAITDGKQVRMVVVDGADHMFRDLYTDDAVEAIDAFLTSIGN